MSLKASWPNGPGEGKNQSRSTSGSEPTSEAAIEQRGLVLTAGPSITSTEIDQVMDAVTNGWNARHSEYIRNFQTAFAEYIGVKHAMCTSSCTGALHLSLAALGIKAGDEVIVPENTWVATATSVTYVGATPVFVDIDADTWCMNVKSFEKAITPRTRAVMPVHLYGHPCEMDAILEISKRRGLKIIEDAAPSVGAEYKGRKTGSFGDTSAFSFQGAKIMVSGEGGMFCTNDPEVYRKAQYLNDYAVDTNKSFWIDEIGFKYRMSNLQAAIGLAQLKRIDELVNRKRQIFSWYRDRLSDIPEIALNAERPGTKNIFWMTSIVLAEDFGIERDAVRAKLKELQVDSRPFFFPLSSLPVFGKRDPGNPVAYSIAKRGINLPSGHNLNEDDIDFICRNLRKALGRDSKRSIKVGPWGKVLAVKNSKPAARVDIAGMAQARLEAITYDTLQDPKAISLLSKWRKLHAEWFPAQFPVTDAGTTTWLKAGVLDVKDRVLFWVIDSQGNRVGHVGLFRFSLDGQACEIDNIVRGEQTADPGLMLHAVKTLVQWQKSHLKMPKSFLRVFSDNERAIALYRKLGYNECQRVPLKKVDSGAGRVEWKEVVADPYLEVSRYFVTMSLNDGH